MDYRSIFKPDAGTLLDIMVFNVQVKDWQHLLASLSKRYSLFYSEDGVSKSLPHADSIFQARLQRSVMLEIMLPGFTLNSYFFLDSEIEIDLRPEDINSEEKAAAVFEFMMDISKYLGKEVFLTPEYGSGSVDKRRELALCVANSSKGLKFRV